jgi:hypothetical protein
MSSSLRFPTNWVVYSNSFPLHIHDETPLVETPLVETPSVETPSIETPLVETPSVETPSIETPLVETPSVETPSVETPSVETPSVETLAVVIDTTFILEYFTTKPDEFTVPRTYGRLMKDYNSLNTTEYYLSRLHLSHGQLSCSNQLENGMIVHIPSPTNVKNKLTLVLSYNGYRKRINKNKSTYVHTLNQVYDVVQPRNRPVVEEREGRHRRHHHEERHDDSSQ